MQTIIGGFLKYYEVVPFEEDEDLDTFLERIKYRYEVGDTKVTKSRSSYYYEGLKVYQLSNEGTWELYLDDPSSREYCNMDISLKIFDNDKQVSDLSDITVDLESDFIFPDCSLAMLNRARTERRRRKSRVKPACIKEKEEEETITS
jgi:hypothetical protein